MEQVQFQQQQFQGIVPVLDVGDPSESLASAQSQLVSDQNDRLGQLQRDSDSAIKNTESAIKGLQDLASLSKTASETFVNYSRQQTKKEASAVWAEAIANFESPEIELEGENYKKQEQEQAQLEQNVNTTVGNNLQKIEEPTAEDAARAGRVRESSGLMSTVAANARAYAAMDSYGPAFQNYLTKFNQSEVKAERQPVEPGSQQWLALRDEFNRKWSQATGLSSANPGFSAAYVYPKLRQEMGRRTEQYTKVWNVGHADRQTEKDLFELVNNGMNLEQFWASQRGLTRGDGVSLKTNDDVWRTLGNANLTFSQLSAMSDGKNPATNQSIKTHPRFNALLTEARQREVTEFTARQNTMKMTIQQELMTLSPNAGDDEMNALQERLIQQYPTQSGLIRSQIQTAKQNNADAARERELIEQLELEVQALPEGGKLPAGRLDGMPDGVRRRFGAYMAPSDQNDSIQERLGDSEIFKSIEKDLEKVVAGIDPNNIKFGTILSGATDPRNWNIFKTEALREIKLKAQMKMLAGDGLTEDEALKQALAEWTEEQKALKEKGEFFDPEKNEFKGAALEVNRGLQQATRMQIDALNSATYDNLGAGLLTSDYSQPPSNGVYSERVHYLGRRFGLTPEEVVNLTRQQKGLAALPPSVTEQQLQMIPAADRAKIAALDDQAPISLAIRAQINSGQTLTGNAKQRTVAVGQHLLRLGYGGIWQHPDFNYDSGFTGSGREENSGHTRRSFHRHNEALDIGEKANSPQKLEQLYQYLLKNKTRFGIAELYYDPTGSRGHPAGPDYDHRHHVHVSFGGGDKGTMQ